MNASNRPLEQPGRVVSSVLFGLIVAWFAAVAWAASSGTLRAIPLPALALLVAAGIALPTLAYRFVVSVRSYVRRLGLVPLTLLHVWRIPAALVFFHYGFRGELPPLFWVLAGAGDLVAGTYAARLLVKGGDAGFYRSFHRFGFGDFVVAVGTGLAFTLLGDPRMAAIAELPLALIPFFGVGISGASHLIAFDLLRESEPASPRGRLTSAVAARPAEFATRFGKWAVVTGASSGIGREFAKELARRGLDLVLVARNRGPLESLARECGRLGSRCRIVDCDLAMPEGQERVISETADLEAGLLVAAAGFGTSGPFIANRPETELEMLAVNCGAVLRLVAAFAPRFAAAGRGGIVLMSSIVAFQGVPGAAHYAATKAWVQALAEGLRGELAAQGVAVLAVAPGPVASGFGARARMNLDGAMPAQRVPGPALDALSRGGTVRPGVLSKLLGLSLATLPRAARVRVMAHVMAGLTRELPR